MASENNIKVLVRVRPLLPRESSSEQEIKSIVSMPPDEPSTTILEVPITSSYHSKAQRSQAVLEDVDKEYKSYTFDESIWSYEPKDENYIDNSDFYMKCGPELVEHIFQGYNVCLLAYGQTSSGKTHTMMGTNQEPGFMSQIVRDMMKHRESLINDKINCELRLTYVEVYNEQIKDLFATGDGGKKCRVREHPVMGPYIENLKEFSIDSFDQFQRLLRKGNDKRSTASTSMNDTSSRSHAILTLSFKQTKFTDSSSNDAISIGDAEEEMVSSIKFVDLAGSERLSKTKVFDQQERLKEGTLINKSLTVLGRCINLLANANNTSKPSVIPYRDSVLTYILKENLSGNSKTFMIFCVSPLDFEETYQTLNYANQVKRIKTAAKANKTKLSSKPIDWEAMRKNDHDVIRDLQQEIADLTAKLSDASLNSQNDSEKKVYNLLSYLQNEVDKMKFENRYLKQQLTGKSSQMEELDSHVRHLNREYVELSNENTKLKKSVLEGILAKSSAFISNLDEDLVDFDPKRVF